MLLTSILLALIGFGLLMVAGDKLVDGAVSLGHRLRWSSVFVGIIIIGFGTSLPEVLTAIAALQVGAPDMALGNVIGSNTANVGLIMGFALVVSALYGGYVSLRKTRLDYLLMLAVLLIFSVLLYTFPQLGVAQGVGLLSILALYLAASFYLGKAPEVETAKTAQQSWGMIALLVIGGLFGLAVGAKLLVMGATDIARYFGITERVIGLTMIAIGTSLPELSAAYAAAKRQQLALTAGNILGSNAFNCGAAVGIPLLFGTMATAAFRPDIWVMLGFNLAVFALFFLPLGRPWHRGLAGALLLIMYVIYDVTLFQA